ncbi:MAG: hypothetical protein K5665_05675 [Saccharofermentans sp.]|nr:hypothetical protein [Saccharofermentans sp.]
MEIIDKYIPREYLALKINYCRQRLDELPEFSMLEHNINGVSRKIIRVDSHRYFIDSRSGERALNLLQEREEIEAQLKIYEAIWNINFKGKPLPECKPCQIKRYLSIGPKQQVLLNKDYFDSLKNDDNKKYAKYKNNFFNGIYYRSATEKDIAIYYTEMGIPFKYEPSVTILGLDKPINPDFALYIEELDSCKFHEHLGMKEYADYQKNTKIKYSNYIGAGLVPELDIIYTHDKEDVPFDIRYLSAKLNSAVYGSIICRDP